MVLPMNFPTHGGENLSWDRVRREVSPGSTSSAGLIDEGGRLVVYET